MADTELLRSQIRDQIEEHKLRIAELEADLKKVEDVERLHLKFQVRQSTRPTADSTVADVAAFVLAAELGGEAHGKDILARVVQYKSMGGEHQMEALGAAMKRDMRFEKDEERPNYWRLKTA